MSTSDEGHLRSRNNRVTFRIRVKSSLALGVLALSGSFVAATAVGAAATSASKASPAIRPHAGASVTPDIAYFKGKTITFLEYGAPASAPDDQALTLAPYIGAYLHCTVNVVYNVGAGGLLAQNIAATSAPNGLTLGTLNPVGDIGLFVNNTPGLEFNLRTLPLLPSLPPSNTVIVTTPASGITSFKQMVDSSAPISELATVNSTVGVQSQLLYGAYKIPNHFIYGYVNAAALVTGITRGDGEATIQAFTVFQSLIIGHQVNVVLQSAPPLKGEDGYSIVRKVPTLEEFAATDPPKTKDGKAELAMLENLQSLGSTYFLPPGTPAKLQAALAAAIEFAATRGGAKTALLNVGLGSGYILPGVIKKHIASIIAQQPKLTSWLQQTGAP